MGFQKYVYGISFEFLWGFSDISMGVLFGFPPYFYWIPMIFL